MRLAYVSPMPPARTGIATYSQQLTRALAPLCELTVFTPTHGAEPAGNASIVTMLDDARYLKALRRFDRVLYHIGNNPWFHLDIYRCMALVPGAVCLHDTVIYYLVAGMGRGALLKELLMADPEHAFAHLRGIERDSVDGDLLRYPTPSRHPCVRGLLSMATQVIVHNATSAAALRELGYARPIDVIPLLHYAEGFPPESETEVAQLRSAMGFDEGDVVFGAFGFIGPTKRLDKVLEAIAAMANLSGPRRPRLLIVGEGDSLDEAIARHGLGSVVTRTGFIPDREFRRYLAAIDVLVNLRYPSHGESSATLIQAMSYGKPCIVSAHGSFDELPDAAVVKIPVGGDEVNALARCMSALVADPAEGLRLGAAAREHILAEHAPAVVARRFVSALWPEREHVSGASAGFDPLAYLRDRVRTLATARVTHTAE